MRIYSAVLATIVLYSNGAVSQEQLATVRRDLAAVSIVERAANQMGNATGALIVLGTVTPTKDSAIQAGKFRWVMNGDRFRFENPSMGGTNIFLSDGSTQAVYDGKKWRKLMRHVAIANFSIPAAPIVLNRFLKDTRYSATVVKKEAILGRNSTTVRLSRAGRLLDVLTQQDWTFDDVTGVPVAVEYNIPSETDARDISHARVELRDFRLQSGVLLPWGWSISIDGTHVADYVAADECLSSGISDSEFATGVN